MTDPPEHASAATAEATAATADEVMTVVAARELRGRRTCFVGIGLPSIAASLARQVHEPSLVLIYESGPIGARPTRAPLSIGDGELAETALDVVGVPEVFSYWLQGGRIDVGFLGAAQICRYGNINTTVIGPYRQPMVRLPGAGGAPEIAASAREVIVVARHTTRTFVNRLDFVTSIGHHEGGDSRKALGLPGDGPTAVITNLGVLRPEAESRELVLTAIHPGVTAAVVRERTGWPLRIAASLTETEPPTELELDTLRRLSAGRGTGSAG